MLTLKNFNYHEPVVHSDMQWPCPDGFHVPLSSEWEAVKTVWTTLGGSRYNWTNFGIALKLPFAGNRKQSSADVGYQGSIWYYWSSTYYNIHNANILYFDSDNIQPNAIWGLSFADSIRCFKDSPVTPTSSWTKLYWTSIEAGWIFWDSDDWLISLSSNWTDWITIQDKNLWATQVWNSWDTLSEANCGKYFQRWNNYWFPFTWTLTDTSTTQVDANWYWPWNYYNSSTFIKYNWTWDSSSNANLRWWVTQWTWTD